MTVHLIGGVSRAGKSLLGQRLADLTSSQYVEADGLVHGIHGAWPGLGVTPYCDSIEAWRASAHAFWPMLRELILADLRHGVDSVYETCFVWPDDVGEMVGTDGLVAHWLLYNSVPPHTKLQSIRAYAAQGNPCYSARYDDQEMLAKIALCQQGGAEMAARCDQSGISYSNIGAPFEHKLDTLACQLVTRASNAPVARR